MRLLGLFYVNLLVSCGRDNLDNSQMKVTNGEKFRETIKPLVKINGWQRLL